MYCTTMTDLLTFIRCKYINNVMKVIKGYQKLYVVHIQEKRLHRQMYHVVYRDRDNRYHHFLHSMANFILVLQFENAAFEFKLFVNSSSSNKFNGRDRSPQKNVIFELSSHHQVISNPHDFILWVENKK